MRNVSACVLVQMSSLYFATFHIKANLVYCGGIDTKVQRDFELVVECYDRDREMNKLAETSHLSAL